MAKRKYATYYDEINDVLQSFERHKPWHEHSIDWVCDRIDWCWKYRKINNEQMTELSDRVVAVLDADIAYLRG